jgi:hypothetical protein
MRLGAKKILPARILACALVLALVPAVLPAAGAICPNTVETGEQSLWNVHNCWTAFRDWFRPYFNLQSSQWDDGWGWTSCQPTEAFPKMWNSAYLLTYGLNTSVQGPWHSDVDYYTWASGNQHGFRYEPEYGGSAYAQAFWGWFTTDRVEMRCPSFNYWTASSRAAVMLHESTHHITHWSHQSNPPGSNCPEPCSDDWYFHYLNSYSYGSLAGHTHSMIQIQVEYLCDLAQFSEGWVPYQISSTAQSEANNWMTNRIRNPPGWTCGQPRPIYVPPPPPPPPPPGCETEGFTELPAPCTEF